MPENEDYYSVNRISQSQIKVFLKSKEGYYHQFVDGQPGGYSSGGLFLGTLMHALVLEPETFESLYTVYDELDRPAPTQTFAAKVNKDWKLALELKAESDGKALVSNELISSCQIMLDRLHDHKLASNFLWELNDEHIAHNELNIYWIDAATELELKSRVDRLIINHKSKKATIIDYKTTSCSNLYDFGWSVKKYGYDTQAAFYEDAVNYWLREQGFMDYEVNTLFVAQRTASPFTILGVIALGAQKLEAARSQYKQALIELKECMDTGIWKQDTEIHMLFPDKEIDEQWDDLPLM